MESKQKKASLEGRIFAGLVVIAVMIAILASPLREYFRPSRFFETLGMLRETVQSIWYAPLAFIGILVIGSTCFIPVTLFILAGAFFWGWIEGGFYSLVGAAIAAAISFELSRYVFGDLAAKLFRKHLKWFHEMLDNAGIRSVMLLRLVPGIPFPMFNFGAGLTSLRSRDYMIGSSIGLAVPVFIVSFSTDAVLAGTLSRGDLGWRIVVAALLLAFLVIGVPLLVKRFRPEALPNDADVDPEGPSVVN
ncbi:MAG: VTT domain-containing protein [Thermoanaerobaculia bacterium]|nr:VTT domain-containing protein [Thermoanaerobaculia bacterium]